jgi:hypothetical protein
MDSSTPLDPLPAQPPRPPKKSLGKKFLGLLKNVLLLPITIVKIVGKILKPKLKKNAVVKDAEAPAAAEAFAPAHSGVKKKKGKKFFIFFLIALAILGYFGKKIFLDKDSKEIKTLEETVSEAASPKDKKIPVKGFKVGRFNYEDSLNVLGTIKGAMEFKLSFEVPGVVSSINYREGERYEEGALLISLRQDDILLRLKRAQAEMKKSQTLVQIATDKVGEHEKLFNMGAIPKQTLEKVKLEEDGAAYEYEAARLEAKANESMLEKSNLYAPSAGMIGELKIEEGETVNTKHHAWKPCDDGVCLCRIRHC